MTEIDEVECPYCGTETTVLLPAGSDPTDTARSIDPNPSKEASGTVWSHCEKDHRFVIHYD